MTKKSDIDFKVLDALLSFKVTLKFCADYLNVSEDTIQRRVKKEKGITFKEYHESRLNRTAVKLQQKAIEMAISGNTTLMIFCLKNLAGWSDKQEVLENSESKIKIEIEDNHL